MKSKTQKSGEKKPRKTKISFENNKNQQISLKTRKKIEEKNVND